MPHNGSATSSTRVILLGASSTPVRLWMSGRRISAASLRRIFSRASAAGLSPSASQDGRTIDLSGLALSWLDLVQTNMEGADYAFAAFDLCAAGVGAPHIRQRLGFVADADSAIAQLAARTGTRPGEEKSRRALGQFERRGYSGGLADAGCLFGELDRLDLGKPARGGDGSMGHADCGGSSPRYAPATSDRHGRSALATGSGDAAGPPHVDWRDADWLLCRDGKWRPVEPGTFPLAHGVPGRVGRLRAYGNAIVPALWAELIGAYLDCRP